MATKVVTDNKIKVERIKMISGGNMKDIAYCRLQFKRVCPIP